MIWEEPIRSSLPTIPEDILIDSFSARAPTVANTTDQKANCAPRTVGLAVTAENYKVRTLISLSEGHEQERIAVLYTEDGPNIICQAILPAGWENKIKTAPAYQVFDANSNPLPLSGRISMEVQISKGRVSASFLVFEKLQSTMILGEDFTNRNMQNIFCRDGPVEMKDGSIVPLTGSRAVTKTTDTSDCPPYKAPDPIGVFRSAKPIRLTKSSQTWVTAHCSHKRNVVHQPLPHDTKRRFAAANGIEAVRLNVPFRILVANLGRETINV